jgi:lysozyme family protein
MSLFHKIIPFIMEHEGGYVNHPNDPGGETKYGISKRSYPHLDIKDLTQQDAVRIYYDDYWKDEWNKLGFPMAACMLDTAVNMGVGRANSFLKESKGNYVVFLQLRIAKYKELIEKNPKLKVFEKGWMRRVTELRRFIEIHKMDELNFVRAYGGNRKDIT